MSRKPNLSMCPHCGWLFDNRGGLVPPHHAEGTNTGDDTTLVLCEGSYQAPRNPRADRRRLWNGKPNPHLDVNGNPT